MFFIRFAAQRKSFFATLFFVLQNIFLRHKVLSEQNICPCRIQKYFPHQIYLQNFLTLLFPIFCITRKHFMPILRRHLVTRMYGENDKIPK